MGKRLDKGTRVKFVNTRAPLWQKGDRGTVVTFLMKNGPRHYLHQVKHGPSGSDLPANHDTDIVEDE